MLFEVGETVVYPHHGAAKIEEIKMRTIKGEEKMYLKLKVAQGDLTIEVPAENVDLVGVRDVVGKEGLQHVFEVLRAEFTEEPTNWSRRYKANLEKLSSGDVIKVA
jgi:CarD family transcriptional regulator